MRRNHGCGGDSAGGHQDAPVVTTLAEATRTSTSGCTSRASIGRCLDQALSVFDLKGHTDLNLMRPNQDLSSLTAAVPESMKSVLAEEKPDLGARQGDTTTTFAVALAAFYARIPVGHVEARLRNLGHGGTLSGGSRSLSDDRFDGTPLSADRRGEGESSEGAGPGRSNLRYGQYGDRCAPQDGAPAPRSDKGLGNAGSLGVPVHPGRRASRLDHGTSARELRRRLRSSAKAFPAGGDALPDTVLSTGASQPERPVSPVFRQLGARPNVHLIEPVDYPAIVWFDYSAPILC